MSFTEQDFLKLPKDVQEGFKKMFKATLNMLQFYPPKQCWVHRGTGESMTIEQKKTLEKLIKL